MNECVLVVDDDREIVQAIALLLEKEGYRAVRCRAFDLFPRTGHVETVVLMSRVKD